MVLIPNVTNKVTFYCIQIQRNETLPAHLNCLTIDTLYFVSLL